MTIAVCASCLALAAASLLLPIAPAYDPWAWLLWGREVTRLELSTAQGPAFKPLPVAVTALLAPLGGAAPALWLLVARLGGLAALVLAFLVARRLAGGRATGSTGGGLADGGQAAGSAAGGLGGNRAGGSTGGGLAGGRAGGSTGGDLAGEAGGSAGGGRVGALAGAAAVVGVALTDGFLLHAAVGNSEPLFVALALGALLLALADRHGWALVPGGLAALLRPEAWPFLAAYAAWRAWREPRLRPAIVIGAAAIPAAWLVPEWLGSGDPLRSGARALTPNPGAPALANHPALTSLASAAGLLFVPTAVAVAAVRSRAALLPAAAGGAWLLLVALMAQAGFSGEPRYALPGAALVAVTGGVGVARLTTLGWRSGDRWRAGFLAAAVLPFTVAGATKVAGLVPGLGHQAAFASGLPAAIDAAGGRDRLLSCGRPAVGRLRGPLLAYRLDTPKHAVRADGRPDAVTFRSRLRAGAPLEPGPAPGARPLAATPHWRIESTCRPTTIARTH